MAKSAYDVTVYGVGARVEGLLGLRVPVGVLEGVDFCGGRQRCRRGFCWSTGLDQLVDNVDVAGEGISGIGGGVPEEWLMVEESHFLKEEMICLIDALKYQKDRGFA